MTPRQPLRALAALALAPLAVAGCGGGSQAADIAFVSSRDGVYAIYVMSDSGAGERRLTDEEASGPGTSAGLLFEIEPAWSPDGEQVAFASRRRGNFDVYVTGADGEGTRRLSSAAADETHPSWSPDGGRIAFQRGNPADVWVMDADGGTPRRVTTTAGAEVDPAWSPDGEWIAYQLRRPGTPLGEIWVVRPDGTEAHKVDTLDAASYSPAWSPDSSRIAFSASSAGGAFDIYTVAADGTDVERVTSSPLDEFEPAYSPDGKSIALDRNGAIVVVGPDDSTDELTDGESNDGSPAWRPHVEQPSTR